MANSEVKVIGDKWTIQDGLGYDAYANALAEIISSPDTETPITIGIHGEWGSGKTSLMRMIESKLSIEAQLYYTYPSLAREIFEVAFPKEIKKGTKSAFNLLGKKKAKIKRKLKSDIEKREFDEKLKALGENRGIKTIWFNAWKYSREEALWTALIQTILSQMEQDKLIDEEIKEKIKENADKLMRVVAVYALKFFSHGLVSLPMEGEKGEEALKYDDLIQTINDFEKMFIPLVEEYVGDGRLVIFIDDLDRCLPEKAIEVLEAIKLFLDCERCVFIIGVDRDVIERGIEVKYKDIIIPQSIVYSPKTKEPSSLPSINISSDSSSAKQANEEEISSPLEAEIIEKKQNPITGEKYIEKIIQLPFKLPPILDEDLEDFVQDVGKRDVFKEYKKAIVRGIENNPRKIKRFFNAYELQRLIAENKGLLEKKEEKGVSPDKKEMTIKEELLVKFAIIQYSWRDLYNDIIEYNQLLKELENLIAETDENKRNIHLSRSPILKKYYNKKGILEFLAIPPSFGDEDLKPYIYITSTTQAEKSETHKIEEKLWEDLISGDFTKISSANEKMKEMDKDQQRDYIEKLIDYSEDNKLDVKKNAAFAFSLVSDIIPTESQKRAVNRLLILSRDEDSDVRVWAVDSFVKLKNIEPKKLQNKVMDRLIELSQDNYSLVRGIASWSIGELSTEISSKQREKAISILRGLETDINQCWDPDQKVNSTISAIAKNAIMKLKR